MSTNTSAGSAGGDAQRPGAPIFIETASASFKPIGECSKNEIAGEIMALLAQAEAAADDPAGDRTRSQAEAVMLLNEARELDGYLDV